MQQSNLKTELGLKYPIYWNLAAIEPAFAHLLIYKILTTQPETIVDLGSGLSTVIALKTLQNLGINHIVYSIDSDDWFLEETKNLLIAEGLYDKKHVKLIHAPIREVNIKGKKHLWYQLNKEDLNLKTIDLLNVDGPVGTTRKEARYPAIPFFEPWLVTGSSILLDDFYRDDEQNIVKKWLKDYKYLEFIYRGESERGTAELMFRDKDRKNLFKTFPVHNAPDPKDVEITRLIKERDLIYNSKSWKVARRLSKAYRIFRK